MIVVLRVKSVAMIWRMCVINSIGVGYSDLDSLAMWILWKGSSTFPNPKDSPYWPPISLLAENPEPLISRQAAHKNRMMQSEGRPATLPNNAAVERPRGLLEDDDR